MTEAKYCPSCDTEQSVESFHRNGAHADGYANYCKACQKAYQKQWRDGRREEVRQSGIPIAVASKQIALEVHPTLESPCWIWQGRIHEGGYGVMSYRGVEMRVHVGVWIGIHGPKGEGMDLDHICRRRPCCNPQHLEEVSRKVNLNRGAGNKGEVNGQAVLTAEKVTEIRRRLAEGEKGTALAQEFGVHVVTISSIKHRKIWKHIP